nr:hypothetical protein [Tanacetum cinerariifolium]
MSSDNVQSAVTYTSISSDSDTPSCGIPLMNANEFPEMHCTRRFLNKGRHTHCYLLTYRTSWSWMNMCQYMFQSQNTQSTMHHQMMTFKLRMKMRFSRRILVKSMSPQMMMRIPRKDPSKEHEPEDEDTKEPSENSNKTKLFEENETTITPPPPRHSGARISIRPQTHMAASTKALTDAFAAGSSLFPLPPTSPTYDQAPLGHRAAMICMRDDISKEDIPPRRRFSFTAPPPGCDVAESSAADAKAPRSQEEDVGYVKALQASERRMMTSIKEVNLRVSYQAQVHRQESKPFYTQLHDGQTNRRDIRLKTNVVRGQRTVYKIELQEVHQAYLSSEARNRVLLVRLETIETHVSRMEWQRQSAEDLAVTQMMRIHALEARARTDMVQDADSSC